MMSESEREILTREREQKNGLITLLADRTWYRMCENVIEHNYARYDSQKYDTSEYNTSEV